MTIRSFATAAILLSIVSACQTREPGQAQGQEAADGAMVVAEINGEAITAAELDDWIRNDLYERETRGGNPAKVYELRAKAIDKMIAERVIESETRRLDLTRDELLEREIDALGGISDEEVRAFYDENSAQMGGASFEEIAPQIRSYLRSQLGGEVIAKLRENANVTVLLEPTRYEVAAEGPSRGPDDARVTIIEFSDFQCPYCKRAIPIIDELVEKYPEDLRIVYRHLPLASHSRARPAAEASVCADGQGKFWEYHDTLFANNRKLSDDDLTGYASEIGLDLDLFKQCLISPETRETVQSDMDAARTAGISATPAFLVNGVLISGAKPVNEFIQVIDSELN